MITEAAAGNMGVVPPAPGFNAGLARARAASHGALFVSDEVMTGFRVSRAGWYGLEGVAPDLMTFGKVMGGGLPAAAFGGRADVMAPARPGRARSTRPAPCPGTRSPPPPASPRCGSPPTRSTPTSTAPPPGSAAWRPRR